MKQKVNLRLVEGDENLVTKHEILYKKDVDQKIQLFKRNNKGLLEAITKGDWDNVVKLYPKDGDGCSTEGSTQEDIGEILSLIGQGDDFYFGKIKEDYADFRVVTLKSKTSSINKSIVDKIINIVKKYTPEERKELTWVWVADGENVNMPYVAYINNKISDDLFILYIYYGNAWIYLIGTYSTQNRDVMMAFDRATDVISNPKSEYSFLRTLLNVTDLSAVTADVTNTITADASFLQQMHYEGVVYETGYTSYDMGGKPEGMHFVLKPKKSGNSFLMSGFSAPFYYMVAKEDGSAPMYVKGTVDATPMLISGENKLSITTKVTSVSN